MRYILKAVPLIFVSCLATSLAAPAFAQDASILAGAMGVRENDQNSFAVQVGYSQRLGNYTSVSAEYVNEGHPDFHHRDGLSPQFWLHTLVPEKGWSFGAGIGPYFYFDTTPGNGTQAYRNDHGWGAIANASVKYHFASNLYGELRASRIKGMSGHDSDLLVVGVGYELGSTSRAARAENAAAGDNTILLLRSRSIVNSLNSEQSSGGAIEYRRTVHENLELSAMILNEGKVGTLDRKGVVTQAWLMRPLTERTILELGAGAYTMRDKTDRNDAAQDDTTHVAPIVSVGVRYRFNPTLRAELTWSRVITNYHRDSDLFLLGMGVSF
jgi:hypothetical protein